INPSAYAFTPYFEFVTFSPDDTSQPAKFQVISLPNGTFNVEMRFAAFDDTLKVAAASRISSSKGSTVSPGAVQVLPLFEVRVTEMNTGVVAVLPEARAGDTRLELQPIQRLLCKNLSTTDKD